MVCEICGRPVPYTKRVIIEGSTMRACPECAKFGKEAVPQRSATPVPAGRPAPAASNRAGFRDIYRDMGDSDLVSDYGSRIRNARTALGLKQEELGRLINERKSVIEQLENGRIRPDDKLIKKVESALKIRLKEKVIEEQVERRGGGGSLTLGDLIRVEEKKG